MANLIVLSDIHLAKIWDELENIFPKEINYLNPNKFLRDIISQIKSTDNVVLNGDLVDYYFCDYLVESNNNWEILLNIIKTAKGKYFFNLGNHDYRKKPYNFSIYGLKHVNISNMIRKKYRKNIGFNKFRFFNELNSIRVNLNKFNPIPKKVSNSPKHYKSAKSEILMLNTGADALTKISKIINPFNWYFLLSSHTPSIGLANKEIEQMKTILSKKDKREVILFLHCPPFFSKKNISPIKLSKFNYSFSLIKNKLTYTIFLKNNWTFLELLLKSKRNIIVITSHTHIPKQYIINKKNKILKDSSIKEINKLRKQSNYIKFISTLPLGAINPLNKIGYLKIENNNIQYNIIKEFN